MNFTIEMLPALEGDCLWIEYGDAAHPHRILVDGGHGKTSEEIFRRIRKIHGKVHFELIVITHVDVDHISGITDLLSMPDRSFTVGDIWFNGWRHLDESGLEAFGPVDGEKLTSLLLNERLPWNRLFGGHGIVVPDNGPLPAVRLDDGMVLTLVSPRQENLRKLKPKWEEICRDAGLDPRREPVPEVVPPGVERMGGLDIEALADSRLDPDISVTNGSSIAFLAEFNGKRVLLGGDAHPDTLLTNLRRLPGYSSGSPLGLDAFKIPHHGSRANLGRDILAAIACSRYLVSTNGDRHHHPNAETVARILKFGGHGTELVFNYGDNPYAVMWDNADWMQTYGYSVQYSDNASGTSVVKL